MKQPLLLFFLLLAPWLNAQYDVTSKELKPFKDYRSCLTGLKNNYGVTVVKAEFDVIEPIYELINNQSQLTGWIVKKANGCGVLSAEGDVQIPVMYETMVRWRSDTLIVGLNGKQGMINLKNEWLLPAKYDQLYTHYRDCFFYITEGKMGVITKELRELTPAVYDAVESAAYGYMGDGYVPQPNIFQCRSGGKTGIIDLRKGELIPPVYDWIRVEWDSDYCTNSEANYIVHKDSLRGVIQSDGQWAVPLIAGEIHIYSHKSAYCGESEELARVTKNNREQFIYNLQTGKKSAEYDHITPFQLRAIGWKGNKWVLLDTNFTELYASGKYFISQHGFSGMEDEYVDDRYLRDGGFQQSGPYEPHQQFLNWNDDVLYISLITDQKIEGQALISTKRGLLNYKTGKMIPPKYDQIRLREKNGITWYWAYAFLGESDERDYVLTVYDASMKRVESYKIRKALYEEQQTRSNEVSGMSIFCDQKGKWGALSISGETAVSFIHSKCYYLRRQVWNPREPEAFFAFGDEGKMTVFTNEGRPLMRYAYDTISLLSNGIIELRKDKEIDLMTTTGDLIEMKCSHARVAPGLKVNGELNPLQHAYQLCDTSQQSIYFVWNNYLHYYSGGVTKKCDASFFEFASDTLLVSYTYEINQTGLVRQIYDPARLIENRREAAKKSNYQEVRFRADAAPSFYWYSLADKKKGSTWHVLDSLKQPLLQNYDFDYPTLSHMNYHIFRVDGKYGALTGDYKIILPPEYDYVCYNWGDYFVRKEGKWQVYNPKTKQFSEPFDDVSTERYANGRFVFRGEQIGFIDTNFQLILPMQSAEELIQKSDLVAFCGKPMNGYERVQLLNLPMCKEDARIINNRLIVDKNDKKSTGNQMLRIEERPYFWEKGTAMPLMHFTFNQESFFVDRYIERNDQKLLSFYTDEHVIYDYDDSRSVPLKRICSNYRIVNKKLVPVKLNDLLKQDEVSKEKFKELFLKELNAIQFSGLDCPDYSVLLQQAQDNFTVNDIGLYIYLYRYGKLTSLSFDYRQLKGILQKPAEFGL